jgi:hypothetical protein
MTLPAMLASGAFGYLIGKAVCRIPALERAFDRFVTDEDWNKLVGAIADPAIKPEAVALVQSEVGVSPEQAAQIWDAVVATVKVNPRAIIEGEAFKAAAHHPDFGSAKHGLAILRVGAAGGVA